MTGVSKRLGALLGFVTGLAFFAPALRWSGVYVGAVPWLALAILQSLYLLLTAVALAWVSPKRPAVLMTGAVWVIGEWLRSTTPFGGFPWLRLAFSQADAPWTPVVAWAGASGLTFLIAALGGALARLVWVVTGGYRGADRRRQGLGLVAAAVPVLGLVAGVLITPPVAGEKLKVAAVQGNVPTAGLDFNAQRQAVLNNHAAATQDLAQDVQAGRAAKPDVVVWPENASDIDPLRNADAQRTILEAVDAVGAPTLVGAVLSEPAPKVSNASMLYLPKRGVTDRYVKQHPVPFGEYIPYRSFFRTFSKQVDLVRADFVQGQKVSVFSIPVSKQVEASGRVRLAPVICFEVAYDDLLRKPANRGAQLFVVQTNNATFGYTDESTQQLAISRIRALEYGRSIVHVSTVGVSALITPDGAAHQRTELFTRKVLTGELPLRDHATFAQRIGRAPEYVSTAALVMAVAIRARRRKSSAPQRR